MFEFSQPFYLLSVSSVFILVSPFLPFVGIIWTYFLVVPFLFTYSVLWFFSHLSIIDFQFDSIVAREHILYVCILFVWLDLLV